ncbi:hypothetical protein I4U23_006723 [Adineta vaga]|nr:hypothetical protein I4U23_006723 [Adineta vaga]
MDVLHYSFSLSACPKCHLLVCKHTSLANLDFRSIEQELSSSEHENDDKEEEDDDEEKQSIIEPIHRTSNTIKTPYQRLSSHGMNFYVLPSTTISDNRHSWTTFGSDTIESIHTLENSSLDHETLCDNTPFANENIIHSTIPLKPTLNQLVRTQSERCQKNYKPHIYLTKSYSFSTIYTTPKSLTISPHIPINTNQSQNFSSNYSIFIFVILIISYLLTNTLDIVLLYIYYHTNSIYFLIFTLTLVMCDIILWINNLIDRKNLSTRFLLIPFLFRFYILYALVEFILIRFNKTFLDNTQLFDSTSTPSSSTTTTLETNISQTTDSILLSHHRQRHRSLKRQIFHYLTLFYLIHSSFLLLINLYFWSNHFQSSIQSTLNMDYFIPKWMSMTDNQLLSSTSINMIPIHSSISVWSKFDHDRKHLAHRTLFYHQLPLNIRLPSASTFILISIFYHLFYNYSFLSTILNVKRPSLLIIISILSRFCLLITRIYTFIFLFHRKIYWFPIVFSLVHLSLMMTLLIERSKHQKHHRRRIFLQIIFSFITHSSINDICINALVSLENISIFLHRLYLETFSLHNETTFRLIIFLSIMIAIQILGFLFDILSRNTLYRTETTNQTLTKL